MTQEVSQEHQKNFDTIVCAEIPNKEQFSELHKTVTTFMMHGPCETSNPNSPCQMANVPKSFLKSLYKQHLQVMDIHTTGEGMMGNML